MKTDRKLVWAFGKWHICVLVSGAGGDRWEYAGSRAFCCYNHPGVITHELPPKPPKP